MINVIPTALLLERDGVSIVQKAGWAPGMAWKTSAPPRFDPQMVQLIASRCTDYATTALQLGGTVRD